METTEKRKSETDVLSTNYISYATTPPPTTTTTTTTTRTRTKKKKKKTFSGELNVECGLEKLAQERKTTSIANFNIRHHQRSTGG